MESIIDLLHKGGYSCVMKNGEEVRTFTQRGVADLYDLYQANPSFMKGASIADKVIGKGAAALMVLGGLKAVYADIISTPALALLREAGIEVTFASEVPHIINRAGTGRCPLETACGDLKSVEEMYPVICNFITGMRVVKRIKSLITQGETSEVEFKSARGGFPGSFWESYSAFANTNGGTIVLGVVERNNQFFLDGLTEESIVRYKKNFWDCAHNKGKINVCLPRESDIRIEKVEESYILICDIPRASYELRPIYIGSNPFGNTYRRNHEGDYLCTDAEVRRMFADAEHDRHPQDGRILVGYDFERDIDMESLHQYRQTFASLQPSHPWVGISDMDFLKKIGAYATEYETGKEGFTLAGILMFGKYDSITNNSGDPMFFVDYRECIAADNPDTRWTHRIYPDGMWEANLYQFYIRVYNRLIQSLPRPFMIKNGIRQEETPAHDAVREALINALIHQDVNAMGNIIVERTDDNLIFRNPGMMLVSKQQYFEGGRSICRNPILQKMFMRLGRAEKAGSGVDKIVSGWLSLGWPLPTVAEETRPDYVVLTMQLGIEARQENPTRKPDKKTRQENPTRKPRKQDLRKEQILKFCVEPKSLYDILQHLGLKDRENLMEVYINPMIGLGILEMTEPDNPTSRNQMYITVKVEM